MTALVKSSKALKTMTSTIRHHLDAVERAREIYLNQMKRAEAEYFERIKKATETHIGTPGDNAAPAAETSEQAAPQPTQ